jgi:hypothetical protein
LLVVVCVVGGSLAGALASIAVGQQARPGQIAPASGESAADGHPPVGVSAQAVLGQMDLEGLRRRVAELEKVDAGPQGSGAPSAPIPIDPIASQKANVAAHNAAIAAHMAEAIDPKWAPAANRSFKADLNAVGEKLGFDLRQVDCRTTTCTATVAFSSFAEANRHYADLLRMRYGVNCTREVTLDDPGEQGGAFETTVVYDCTGSRASDTR